MSLSNSIKKMLNIKENNFKILSIEDVNIKNIVTKQISAILSKKKANCPHCSSKKTVKNGFKIVKIKMLKAFGYDTVLKVAKQRYICKDCNKSFMLNLDIVEPCANISKNIKLAIVLELKKSKSLKDIAEQFSVSQSTVRKIFEDLPSFKNNYNYLPEVLCFDEFKSTKDINGAMSFIYCDANTSKIIDIVEDRKLKSLQDHFSNYPKTVRDKVKNIVIDMHSPYISLVKSMFPKASLSIDRFHLVQLINRAFNKIRVITMNRQNNRMYNKLKKHWKLLLVNSLNLSDKKVLRNKMFDYKYLSQEDMVNIMLSCDKNLKNSYNLYQDILIAIQDKNFKKFKEIVENNYNKFDVIMKTVLKTFKKYFEYIENSLNFEYSNARVEGSVRKIKVLKNIAYGFRSFINFKKRILLCANF